MNSGIIDFHTHAFPNDLAARAIGKLSKSADSPAYLDGTVSGLLASMDSCGIEKSVICSIATKPSQFGPILEWSRQIRNDRVIPLPSVHPNDPGMIEHIKQVSAEGFPGIKLHPYYQEFFIDEERLFPLYEALCNEGILLVLHTGFDIAFPPERKADPEKLLNLVGRFPDLRLVTTHLGSWQLWKEVEDWLIGKKIFMEISFGLEYLSRDDARRMILSHPEGYILFGTDSPWTGQAETLTLFRNLGLDDKTEHQILRDNALRILGLS